LHWLAVFMGAVFVYFGAAFSFQLRKTQNKNKTTPTTTTEAPPLNRL